MKASQSSTQNCPLSQVIAKARRLAAGVVKTGRTREDLKDMVKIILDVRKATTIITNNRPVRKRVGEGLLKRHPIVREGIPTFGGGERFNVKVVYSFHAFYMGTKAYSTTWTPHSSHQLTEFLTLIGQDSAYAQRPKTLNVIGQTGAKHVDSATSGYRLHHHGLHLRQWPISEAPPYLLSPTKTTLGWITEAVFVSFLKDVFIPHLEREGTKRPVVLRVDGHFSDRSL